MWCRLLLDCGLATTSLTRHVQTPHQQQSDAQVMLASFRSPTELTPTWCTSPRSKASPPPPLPRRTRRRHRTRCRSTFSRMLAVGLLYYGDTQGKRHVYSMPAFIWDVPGNVGLFERLLCEHVLPRAMRWHAQVWPEIEELKSCVNSSPACDDLPRLRTRAGCARQAAQHEQARGGQPACLARGR
jgi:hypothetical protein